MKLVFDFDGTIHKTDIIYKKAMEISLQSIKKDIKEIDYKSLIGKSPHLIWKELGVSENKIDNLVKETGKLMDENMIKFGKLYDKTEEVLSYLQKNYELIICSNCRNSYMDHARKAYKLDKYFSSYITGETHRYIDKYEILKKLNLGKFIMIGDRENDIDAGYKNNMKTIFAKYGFGNIGEARNADFIIDDISDLKKIL